MKAAKEGEDLYLLKCTKGMYQAERAQKDKWHNNFFRGGLVVEGFYNGQVDEKCDLYTLLDHKPPVMIYSHLIRAIRFLMEPISRLQNLFKLTIEVYETCIIACHLMILPKRMKASYACPPLPI